MEENKVVDIISDISKITTIPGRTMDKLISKMDWCICDAVEESIIKGNELTIVNIGMGLLYISTENSQVQ